jgi:hypothetical protein
VEYNRGAYSIEGAIHPIGIQMLWDTLAFAAWINRIKRMKERAFDVMTMTGYAGIGPDI